MDSFQDEVNYNNRIVPEDRDKLISLLEEYSDKLSKKCDFIDNNTQISNRNFRIFKYTISITVLLAIMISCYSILVGASVSSNASWLSESFRGVVFGVALLLISSLSSYILNSVSKSSFLREMQRPKGVINSRTHEAHSLAHRLEKLVRIASQFYEHVETKRISKIELDLKIAEAESVLHYYDSIVGKPK
jgi:Ni/Fe-hydrogenase subunit HybB-like protein